MRWPAICAFVPVTLLTACAPLVGAAVPQAPAVVMLGEPFTLATGATAIVGPERTAITFDVLVSDSRCPTDVQCIRAGEAVIRVVVEREGNPADTVELQTTPNRDRTRVDGYTLTLTRVVPEPNTKVSIEAADYRATFLLTQP